MYTYHSKGTCPVEPPSQANRLYGQIVTSGIPPGGEIPQWQGGVITGRLSGSPSGGGRVLVPRQHLLVSSVGACVAAMDTMMTFGPGIPLSQPVLGCEPP